MKSTVVLSSFLCLAACTLFTGCASIVSGRYADVAIDSCPSNAHVVIHDNNGREVAAINTPGVVSLKRNRRYFLPARYTAVIQAPGYAPTEVPIRSTLNPWMIGNIVIGGVPGLVVDSATGAVWRPRHSEIHGQLAPLGCPGPVMMSSTNQPAPPVGPQTPPYMAERPGQTAPPQRDPQNLLPPPPLN